MEVGTVKDAFDRVTKKQKLSISKSQEIIDQVGHEIEQALVRIQSDSASPVDLKSNIRDLKAKLNDVGSQNQLESSQKDLNGSLGRCLKVLEKTFNSDIGKAYRNVDSDTYTVNEIILSHLYHQGLFDVGDCLISEAGGSEASELKLHFLEMHHVLNSMKAKNVSPALSWISSNREKLKQTGSDLELKLHKLQFVEILLNGGQVDALNYARTHLAPLATVYMEEIQRLMGCLIFAGKLDKCPYPELVAPNRWEKLIDEVAQHICKVLGQSCKSPLSMAVAAGIEGLPTLLKLASVMAAKKQEWVAMKQLPVPVDLGREFQFHSVFVCPVSRDQESEENPPMLMPCSHVLCKQSIMKLSKGSSRMFKCPYCPAEATVAQCRQVYF